MLPSRRAAALCMKRHTRKGPSEVLTSLINPNGMNKSMIRLQRSSTCWARWWQRVYTLCSKVNFAGNSHTRLHHPLWKLPLSSRGAKTWVLAFYPKCVRRNTLSGCMYLNQAKKWLSKIRMASHLNLAACNFSIGQYETFILEMKWGCNQRWYHSILHHADN